MGKWVHRLTEVDLENKTAVCAVDGPVEIRVHGKARHCRVADRATTAKDLRKSMKRTG